MQRRPALTTARKCRLMLLPWVTPVLATSAAIDYNGMSPGAAFVVVDPSAPASLMALSNARVRCPRLPFPATHEERVLPAARAWLQHVLEKGELSRWRTGDGKSGGPRIYVWQATASPAAQPAATLARKRTQHCSTASAGVLKAASEGRGLRRLAQAGRRCSLAIGHDGP
jgi:hypothetical protein